MCSAFPDAPFTKLPYCPMLLRVRAMLLRSRLYAAMCLRTCPLVPYPKPTGLLRDVQYRDRDGG
eukprot:1349769-Rhodomonas_salina.1